MKLLIKKHYTYYYIAVIVFLLAIVYWANRKVKQSDWFFNHQLRYTSQFQIKSDSLKYDIVNVGSNPARYAFFYENVKGENWSTGTQHLQEDYEILRHYSNQLSDSAVVLLPVVYFTSVTGYLVSEEHHGQPIYWMLKKYSLILPDSIIRNIPGYNNIKFKIQDKLPLFTLSDASNALFEKNESFNDLKIEEQHLQYVQMERNASY